MYSIIQALSFSVSRTFDLTIPVEYEPPAKKTKINGSADCSHLNNEELFSLAARI